MSMTNPNSTKSVLRHRPIHETPIAPQKDVPPRARATKTWQADDQVAIDLPRGSTGRAAWQGDVTPGSDDLRGTRSWTQQPAPKADVTMSEEEKVPSVAQSDRGQRSGRRPAPASREQENDAELVVEREVETEDVDEGEEVSRRPIPLTYGPRRSSAVASRTQRPRSTASPVPCMRSRVTEERPVRGGHVHWLVPLGIGMLLLFLLYVLGTQAFIWGLDRYNDWTYGTTRTVHLDAVVGDHDGARHPTHFLGLNLRGRIEVVEFPGGDATHARVFVGPQLPWSGAEKAVVTLQVRDVNHDGKPDLLVNISGEPALFTPPPSFNYVLQNTRDGLKPVTQPQAA